MDVQSLGWKDPLEEGTAIHSSILAWRIPGQGAWRATVHRVSKRRTDRSDLARVRGGYQHVLFTACSPSALGEALHLWWPRCSSRISSHTHQSPGSEMMSCLGRISPGCSQLTPEHSRDTKPSPRSPAQAVSVLCAVMVLCLPTLCRKNTPLNKLKWTIQ